MTRPTYIDRINRVIDHLDAHPAEAFSLNELAGLAGFSPFHFHRIFKSLTGETVHAFAKRLRLERAARMIGTQERTLLDIALACGFDSSSDFSRSFKTHFGTPPSRFSREAWLCAEDGTDVPRQLRIVGLQDAEPPSITGVNIVTREAVDTASVRIHGAYDMEQFMAGWDTLQRWATKSGAADRGTFLGMSTDDPDLTPAEKYRYDFALTLSEKDGAELGASAEAEGLSLRRMPQQRYASLACRGDIQEVARGWEWLYKRWLPQSIWLPADGACIEAYSTSPITLGWQTFDLELLVPITRGLGR